MEQNMGSAITNKRSILPTMLNGGSKVGLGSILKVAIPVVLMIILSAVALNIGSIEMSFSVMMAMLSSSSGSSSSSSISVC